jgi:hypothetical protein
LREIRRLDVTWTEKETKDYDNLLKIAKKNGQNMPEFVKAVLRKLGV